MISIQNLEMAEKWDESIDRVLAVGQALKYTVKAWKTQGAGQDKTFEAIVDLRESFREAIREEGARFRKATETPNQQEIPGTESIGPRALPPAAMGTDE
jgi:hypothetical protein